jgi:lipid II:glycine glycyltransferase (peptidoglycan interpeptide bridge formation enzyme)
MYASLMRLIGWQVEGKPGSRIFYRPLGPICVAKIQRPKKIDLAWLKEFRHSHHTLTTHLEPGLSNPLSNTELGITVEPFAHSSTSLVDLSPSQTTILASFSQKTRYNIVRTLKKNELSITTTQLGKLSAKQLLDFSLLQTEWAKQTKVIGHPAYLLDAVFASFAQSGDLHLCYLGKDLVGSLLVLYHNSVATYYAAAANDRGYHTYAPTLLTWAAIQQAQMVGCDILTLGVFTILATQSNKMALPNLNPALTLPSYPPPPSTVTQ